MTAELRYRDPYYDDTDGGMQLDTDALDWYEIPLRPTDTCEHSETLCFDCLETWTLEFDVRFMRHGQEMTNKDPHGFQR